MILDPRIMGIDVGNRAKARRWRKRLYEQLLFQRPPWCDCCNQPLMGKYDLHEGIVTRGDVRGWRYPEKAWIFTEYNCIWLLHDHHLNHPPPREFVWRLQCARYGEKNIRDWYESLPFKVHPRRF